MVIPWSPSLYSLGFSKFTHFSRQRVFIIFTLLQSPFLTLFHLCCWIFFMLEEEEWAELHSAWDVESFIHWPIVLPMFLSLLFSMIPYILFFFCHWVLNWCFSENDSTVSIMTPRSPSWMARVYLDFFFPIFFALQISTLNLTCHFVTPSFVSLWVSSAVFSVSFCCSSWV